MLHKKRVETYLWRADHVLLWRHKFTHSVIKLAALPTINALLLGCIPIESLGHVVGQVTHVAAPSMTVIKESYVRIDVGSKTG